MRTSLIPFVIALGLNLTFVALDAKAEIRFSAGINQCHIRLLQSFERGRLVGGCPFLRQMLASESSIGVASIHQRSLGMD